MEYANSPVEADKYLNPGEKPFTAFGHHGAGRLDIRVFLQDEYWVNILGKPFHIKDMSYDYLNAVLTMLFENANTYYTSIARWYTVELISITSGITNPPWDYIQRVMEETSSLILLTPIEWLNESILVKKIVTLLDQKDS